ncbi:pheromone processing endoprotease kex2 [Colletotrichum musicola]|uniref:Pheromone processing endoprotease kex2 n=1 Tax=Colletotrichum musicola TaxID=2175873 RepID=A0A8H6KW24_9PEZI|nr:pheromone processing endoprotease kex2 [Colletotrichum musicola]
MKLSAVLLGLLGLASGASVRNYETNDYYVLELDSSTTPGQVADRLGLRHEGTLGGLDGHHLFSARKEPHDVVKPALRERRLKRRGLGGSDPLDGVRLAQKQVLRKPWEKRVPPRPVGPKNVARQEQPDATMVAEMNKVMQTLQISDPIFNEQWHLLNTVQPGHDINVTGVWTQGITGKNATVAIVDDGLDMYSDDLKPNYYAAGSYDFNDHREEPKPTLSDDKHGTRCAGEVSAARNNVCGVGVAYDSKIAGIRILSKLISDADEAVAMTYDYQHNDIYSCSWGPPDDGRSMDAPGILIKRAMLKGIQQGRGGKGSIYVFASGNGAANDDNCNFDGYTNSIYSITVGAVDRKGQHPYYSEKCSAQLVVTYSSGSGDAIHTTDVGTNACYNGHGGTSAAAPLGAGVYALVLEVRPDLTWRDMQWLAMDTAVPINEQDKDADWQPTKIGKKFSHTFGYGKIDAYAMVEAAKTWKNVKPQAWYYSPWVHVNKDIPQGKDGIAVSLDVTADALKEANLERVEHVTITMNVNHTRRGDLSVDLISPEGVTSHLSVTRKMDSAKAGYVDWTFMSVAHWGESGIGKWTVIVKDSQENEHKGTFVDWHLKLWGESIDASKAKLLPMPTEEDDNDHAIVATTSLPAATTSITHPAQATDNQPAATPSDHPDRPTKVKPSDGATPAETGAATGTQEAAASTSSPSNWVSWLPSFGKAGVWVYGAIALIAVFCSALGIWFYIRKRRNSNARDEYDFEPLNEDETEGLNGEKRTRGRELYDAFAGDDEDEDDEGDYHDDRERSREGSGTRETDRLTEK